jgi:hypothetical protein
MATLIVLGVMTLSTAGLAMFLRALPWPREWTERKPLACPVCMSGWSAFACIPLVAHAFEVAWPWSMHASAWLACVCIGSLVFNVVYPPPLAFPPAE